MTIAADIEPVGAAAPVPALRPAPAVEVTGLCRSFGTGRIALDGVSLRVDSGEIHALLGPNGAGKTTLLRVLAGVTAPTAGRVAILGVDATRTGRELRQSVGVVPAGDRSFYLRISGLENLLFFARLYGLRRRDATGLAWELIERVGLTEAARRRVGEYSMGMQKRLAIARALLPRPRLLLVDEATHDLDPLGGREIRALVGSVAAEGAAVVWATQRLDEVQGFAHRATLLRQGHACFGGTVAELVSRGSSGRFVLVLRRPDGATPTAAAVRRALGPAVVVEPAPDGGENRFLIALSEPGALGAALGQLLASGVDVVSCMQERPEIEHAFLTLTGAGMSILERVRPPSPPATALELAKLGAFVRRDFQIAWSYRMSFVSEWITLAIQVAMFAYVGRLIDPAVLPTYGGVHATYMQFVTIGVAVSALMHLALGRVASGLRTEQLTGTLEPLMLTPTTPATIQFGTVLYDLIYIPLRLAVFLGVVAAVFNLSFDPSGIAPAFVLLLALMPFVWGLGVANAASALTFRRGGAGIGLMISLIALGSGRLLPARAAPALALCRRAPEPGRSRDHRDPARAHRWRGMGDSRLEPRVPGSVLLGGGGSRTGRVPACPAPRASARLAGPLLTAEPQDVLSCRSHSSTEASRHARHAHGRSGRAGGLA